MKKRQLWVSILAGILAALMIFGIIASVLPTYVSAAKSSAQIKEELNASKEELKKNQQAVAELQSQINENMGKMEAVVAQKNLLDQKVFLLHQQVQIQKGTEEQENHTAFGMQRSLQFCLVFYRGDHRGVQQ